MVVYSKQKDGSLFIWDGTSSSLCFKVGGVNSREVGKFCRHVELLIGNLFSANLLHTFVEKVRRVAEMKKFVRRQFTTHA